MKVAAGNVLARQLASAGYGQADRPKTPVLLCIDIEPDEFFVAQHECNPWQGYVLAHAYLKTLRQTLWQVTGQDAHFCWFIRMDPQVALSYGSATWAVDQYGNFLSECMAAGDELGSHVHTYRWCDDVGDGLDDHGNEDWVSVCLETAVEGYKRSFGKSCRALRFGNYWSSTQAINQAEALGFTFDLTIEPGLPPNCLDARKPPHSGDLPDYYRVPREPYLPSRTNFRDRSEHGDRQITLMPLTSAYLRYRWGRESLKQRFQRLRNNGFRHRLQDTPLSMWRHWQQPNEFSHMLDRAIALQRKPYLAFAIHSNFPVEAETLTRVDRCIQALVSHPERSRFVFCTPSEAMAILRKCERGV